MQSSISQKHTEFHFCFQSPLHPPHLHLHHRWTLTWQSSQSPLVPLIIKNEIKSLFKKKCPKIKLEIKPSHASSLPAHPSSPSWSSSSSSLRSSCFRIEGRLTASPWGPTGGLPSGAGPPCERENLRRYREGKDDLRVASCTGKVNVH